MRKIISLAVLALLLVIGGYVYVNFYYVKSDGAREGIIQKLSRNGTLFKTWEGEMVQQGFGARGGNFTSNYLYFSVTNDALADSLNKIQGKLVRLHYVQYGRSLPWRGDNYNGRNDKPGQYIVDRIEDVREVPY